MERNEDEQTLVLLVQTIAVGLKPRKFLPCEPKGWTIL